MCWAKFTNFIFLHIERFIFNSFLPIYSFTFNTVAIFIQHFGRIPFYASVIESQAPSFGLYLLETRVFKDTKIPNVFLVSMDVTSLYTPGGILKNVLYGEAPPRGPTSYPFLLKNDTLFTYLV